MATHSHSVTLTAHISGTCAGEASDREDDDDNDDEAGGQKNTAWIRRAHDAEGLPGRGVRCWVAPAMPLAAVGPQPSDVRVLVGNRALMAEEGVPISRCAPKPQTLNNNHQAP